MATTMRRTVTVGAASLGGVVALGGISATGGAVYFARRVLTPDRKRPDDVEIVAVGDDEVTLSLDPETSVPGRYGLWLQRGAGHARLGDIVATDEAAGTVTRELIGVDAGRLEPGPARWNQYFYGQDPLRSLGTAYEDVRVPTDLGEMSAWLIRPPDQPSGEWAVLVHGRGARRHEGLRAVKPLLDNGITVLIPSYRNDEDAPPALDGRYMLGLSEWHDIERAIAYAVDRGASSVVMIGWSMGGAITLQLLGRSPMADHVRLVVLDAPVVDWVDVLAHHASVNRLPAPVGRFSRHMLGRGWGRRLVGHHDVIDLALTDWVTRAQELRHPTLLIHSADDEFVPVGPSRALAAARPDLVRLEEWTLARHTKEWNTDPDRWDRVVRDFVATDRPR